METVSSVGLTKEVERGGWPWLPFHCTVEFGRKLFPFTVRVNAAPPAVADEGDSDTREGAGDLIEKGASAEEPPPGAGFTTVINAF